MSPSYADQLNSHQKNHHGRARLLKREPSYLWLRVSAVCRVCGLRLKLAHNRVNAER
jgi:hypothetical protein